MEQVETKVDVLAAVDRAARELWVTGQPVNPIALDLISARAAIAELIERERKLREALTDVQAQCRRNVELGAMGPGYWSDLSETVDAALARVGGGK